ncbi:MAG TPA: protein-L-isoaspartate(D-aspartate) O-methyltransferase [Steroidobacter sp.]|jgi:protein-L-isoaspartate(D-aspartate) O-methyltransferase|nr:protein-L-isoaspartate(D-aspartate) O-methyltransferase [Steroidobacter sp.]
MRRAIAVTLIVYFVIRLPIFAADEFASAREAMVREQIVARGVSDPRVLAALRATPRERFVPEEVKTFAYGDYPLPIGEGQTISQPYIAALMTELAQPRATDRVLEVGTGSGYQAAVLAALAAHVYTIELEPSLARRAEKILRELNYRNITTRTGDGYQGWPAEAPFDVIVVTAAPDHVPEPLLKQLKPGGRMVIPVGERNATQQLQLIEKGSNGKLVARTVSAVQFVPLRRPDASDERR